MNPTELARKSLEYYYKAGSFLPLPSDLPESLIKPGGAFVSLHTRDGELRGCIGTILPTEKTAAEEIIQNAVSAAISDDRFSPVTESELENLRIDVDLLTDPVPVKAGDKLDPKKFGLIVADNADRSGVLLPDLPGVDSVEDQIEICCQKANICDRKNLKLYKFQTERHLGE